MAKLGVIGRTGNGDLVINYALQDVWQQIFGDPENETAKRNHGAPCGNDIFSLPLELLDHRPHIRAHSIIVADQELDIVVRLIEGSDELIAFVTVWPARRRLRALLVKVLDARRLGVELFRFGGDLGQIHEAVSRCVVEKIR